MKAKTETITRQPHSATPPDAGDFPGAAGLSAWQRDASASAIVRAIDDIGDLRAGIRAVWMAAADIDDRDDERAFQFMTNALDVIAERVEGQLKAALDRLRSEAYAVPGAVETGQDYDPKAEERRWAKIAAIAERTRVMHAAMAEAQAPAKTASN